MCLEIVSLNVESANERLGRPRLIWHWRLLNRLHIFLISRCLNPPLLLLSLLRLLEIQRRSDSPLLLLSLLRLLEIQRRSDS